MKKKKHFWISFGVIILTLTGCSTISNQDKITPTTAIESSQTDITPTIVIESSNSTVTPKPTTKVFQKKEEPSKTPTASKMVITKTEGLCEQLERVEISVEAYNTLNQMFRVWALVQVSVTMSVR